MFALKEVPIQVMPASVMLGSELVPSGLEGTASLVRREAAGVIAISHYRYSSCHSLWALRAVLAPSPAEAGFCPIGIDPVNAVGIEVGDIQVSAAIESQS